MAGEVGVSVGGQLELTANFFKGLFMKYIFTLPNGGEIINPSNEFIEEFIATTHIYYSQDGCGEACIELRNEGSTLLSIRFHPAYGFSFEYCQKNKMDDSYSPSRLSCGSSAFGKVIEVQVGGMPMKLPEASFLTPLQSKQLVEMFINYGKIDQDIPWLLVSTLPLDVYGQ